MYSMKKIDSKEYNTANVLCNKKIVRHKMKRIKSKTHKLGTYGIDKIYMF